MASNMYDWLGRRNDDGDRESLYRPINLALEAFSSKASAAERNVPRSDAIVPQERPSLQALLQPLLVELELAGSDIPSFDLSWSQGNGWSLNVYSPTPNEGPEPLTSASQSESEDVSLDGRRGRVGGSPPSTL
jgi:hypothetical protein